MAVCCTDPAAHRYSGDKIKKNEMAGEYSACGERRDAYSVFLRNVEGKRLL
jgi:hypothetical protein